MKIVVLDGYALNPGDLSWRALEELGDCTVYDRTPPEQTIERARGARIVLTNKTALPSGVIEQLPQLQYIGILATGCDAVDVETARRKGIVVTNVPAYSTQSVAQMVFAHVLNLALHVGEHAGGVREGRWCRSPDFCHPEFPLIELNGKTMGIIGVGRIGQATARLARAFGMRVVACTRQPDASLLGDGRFVDLDEVFRLSDVVSLHCPLTPQTRGLVNAERLKLMKPSAFLINTSRGPVVDERALADALNAGRIAGAGLDVLAVEPPPEHNPLLTARNCYITPHVAWATKEARARLMGAVVANVRAFVEGQARNIINP